jgi:hypothetical protein
LHHSLQAAVAVAWKLYVIRLATEYLYFLDMAQRQRVALVEEMVQNRAIPRAKAEFAALK